MPIAVSQIKTPKLKGKLEAHILLGAHHPISGMDQVVPELDLL